MGFVCLNQGVCAFTYLLSLVCLSVCVPCVRVCMCVQALHRLRDFSNLSPPTRTKMNCPVNTNYSVNTHTHTAYHQ